MSETTSPPSTPERTPIGPVDIEGVPPHLQPTRIESMRRQQLIELNKTLKELEDGKELSPAYEHAIHEQIVDDYLEKAGVTPDKPTYDAQKALLLESSVDSIYEKDWYNAQTVDGETRPPQREIVFERLEKDFKIPEDGSESDKDLGIDVAELTTIRQKYAKLLSDRSKKAGLYEAKGAVTERQDAKEALADMIGAAATDMMDELEARGVPQDKLVARIDEFIQSQMAAMLIDIEDAQSASFRDKSRLTQKALAKWASWKSPEDATLRQRIFSVNTLKKGAVFAVPGAVFGATAGLIGGGVIAGTAAILLARSIARNLAGVKLDNAAHATTLAAEQVTELQQRMDASTSQIHHDLLELADIQAAEIHSHNRKRLIGGTAISLATAGLFSGAAAALGSELMFGKAGEGVKAVTDVPKPSEQFKDLTLDDPWNPPDPELPPPDVPDPSDNVDTYIEAHDAGSIVTKGEGWYHTFKEFGVTGSKQDDLLREIGPQLEKMGEAYRMEDGLWGISRPGELSDEASRLIVDTANDHGWLKEGLDSVHTDTVPEALSEVKPGEGILQTLQDAGVEDPTLQDVTAVQDQLVDNGAAYADGPGGYAGLNLPENGVMNDAGINTVMDYADNKQLDSSVSNVNVEDHTVGQGENAVDYQALAGVEQAGNDHLTYLETTEMRNDIHEMSDMLNINNHDALNQNINKLNANADYQNALQYIQQDLKGLTYPGTDTLVIEPTYAVGGQQWKFNAVPDNSYMPVKAINTLVAYEQSRFALTS